MVVVDVAMVVFDYIVHVPLLRYQSLELGHVPVAIAIVADDVVHLLTVVSVSIRPSSVYSDGPLFPLDCIQPHSNLEDIPWISHNNISSEGHLVLLGITLVAMSRGYCDNMQQIFELILIRTTVL